MLLGIAHDKQRETAAERAKKGPSARNFRRQPVRHWDHWLHQNADRASTHLIVATVEGGEREDLTPDATTEFWIEPHLDVSADGHQLLASWAEPGADREEDSSVLVIDLVGKTRRLLGQAGLERTETHRDLAGLDRVSGGRRPAHGRPGEIRA